ncbi:MAG: ATPase [Acidobacteria bacterium]|nr:MAG: ATPase [Acidobacteriota bacterium]
MKAKSATVKLSPRTHAPEYVLGVDGGGTKTHAVIADEHGRVLGEGFAGPSNPLRVGVNTAAAAVREAVDQACDAAGVQRADIVAAEVGLAGVRRADLRERMRESLMGLGINSVEVVTDAEIALYGATGGAPGLVLIAGTGSICCGRNARGKRVCAGGWGPLAGDEGGGAWLARRALQAVAHASDGRGPATTLSQAACAYFNVTVPDDLSMAIYAPSMTNERIAGFGRCVVEAAQKKDAIAREIITEAGRELGKAAVAVIRKLQMEQERFQVAYVGGVFRAGELILNPLREVVTRVAAQAYFAPPQLAPAIAATRMAHAQLQRLALAG